MSGQLNPPKYKKLCKLTKKWVLVIPQPIPFKTFLKGQRILNTKNQALR